MVPSLQKGDALLVVDVQRDFLAGGALPIPDGDAVVPVLNQYIRRAGRAGIPVIATRDWHPADHCSFLDHGGVWPAHCIAGTRGADFAPRLRLEAAPLVISKATQAAHNAYSAFGGTTLADTLAAFGVKRLWVGGLPTEYSVLHTVLDACKAGIKVFCLADACRAVNADDGATALAQMQAAGAAIVREAPVPA